MTLRKFTLLTLMLVLALGIATTAYAQDPAPIGDPVSGELNESIDNYSFTAAAGELFIISLESEDFDPLVEVFNSVGNMVGRDDDSGEGNNALMAFLAQEDGNFTFTAGSWLGEATGAYTLTVTQTSPAAVDYDSSVTLETNGVLPIYAGFAGKAGDVLNIWAISTNEEDTRIRLIGPNGEEVEEDDDDGPDTNPYLRRTPLPFDGLYLIQIEPLFDRELTGTIDVTIQATESLPLTDAVSSVTLGTEADVEIFSVDLTAGSTYQITVRAMNPDDTTRVNVIGPDGWAVHTLSIDGASMGVMEFTAETSGTLAVELDPFFFDETATYEISIVPAG